MSYCQHVLLNQTDMNPTVRAVKGRNIIPKKTIQRPMSILDTTLLSLALVVAHIWPKLGLYRGTSSQGFSLGWILRVLQMGN